jgi:hypothetical protein
VQHKLSERRMDARYKRSHQRMAARHKEINRILEDIRVTLNDPLFRSAIRAAKARRAKQKKV